MDRRTDGWGARGSRGLRFPRGAALRGAPPVGTGGGAQDPAAPRGWARRAGGAPALERGGDRTHVCTHSAGWGVFPERRSVTPRAEAARASGGKRKTRPCGSISGLEPVSGPVCPRDTRGAPGDGPRAALPAPRPAHKCPLHSVCPGGGNTCSVTVTCQGTKNSPPGERGRWQASWLALEPRRPGGGGPGPCSRWGCRGRAGGLWVCDTQRCSTPRAVPASSAPSPRAPHEAAVVPTRWRLSRRPRHPMQMQSRALRRSHVLTVSAPARHPRRPPSQPHLAAWHHLGKSRGWLPCQVRGARGVRPGAREREECREGGPLPPRPREGGQRSDY